MDMPPGSDPLKMQHRFILLGRSTQFAYHLSLFHVPAHAFQLMFRPELDTAARTAYIDDLNSPVPPGKRRYHSLFTSADDPFRLGDLASGARASFTAQVERVLADTTTGGREFQTLLDGTGRPVTTTVKVQPPGVRYFEPIGTTDYPPHFTGLLFGTTTETYLAHRLARPDHWDEVREVTALTPAPTQAALDEVPLVTVATVRDTLQEGVGLDQQQSPFAEKTTYRATLTPRSGGTPTDLSFATGEQRWWNSTSLNTAKP
ncbi:hypothetical protein [Kitasatospora sp. NPDC088351]|uniref:hypothetical protein n=1 Tax=Kitasatospora sp. NPDC088351 TaxID=3155180 RepID=UPI003439A3BE